MSENHSRLADIIAKSEQNLFAEWVREQLIFNPRLQGGAKEAELRERCREFLHLLREGLHKGASDAINSSEWEQMRHLLADISRSRSEQGYSPSETATFVLSLKKPLFQSIRDAAGNDSDVLADETWRATELLDKFGLHTTELYQKTREEIISRQQQEMLELSTPVVSLADNILALPVIGTLDSARTQIVMESLLQRIVETGSTVAIIDITGVPTVDTLVAQHLLKTVTAARLMGADCIISGIRPQIAQTIVHPGVDLGNVTTKATLASAFKLALDRTGARIVRAALPQQRLVHATEGK